jgi:hypothetical protein
MNKKLLVIGLLFVGAVQHQKARAQDSISLQLPAHYAELIESFLTEATKVADKAVTAAHDTAQQLATVADKAVNESLAAVENITAEIKAEVKARKDTQETVANAKAERIAQAKIHAIITEPSFVQYLRENASDIMKTFTGAAIGGVIGGGTAWALNEVMTRYVFDWCAATAADKVQFLGAYIAVIAPLITAGFVYRDYQMTTQETCHQTHAANLVNR